MFWDFHVNNQESIHALMFLFGDRGLPSSVRHVNAYSGNTYKFTKADGSYHYVRIHLLSNQGTHYFTNAEAASIAGTNPDHHLQDLQDAIRSGNFPSWDVYIQAIHPDDIASAPINIFDMTKIWPHKQYPLRKAGRMVFDKNPQNWFAEIEQAAFSPSQMVPGIEPSPDPMLQARMFAYPDASRYRLGVNYQFLPTNAAAANVYCPTERDGFMNFTTNYAGDPNYVGSKLKPMSFAKEKDYNTVIRVADRHKDSDSPKAEAEAAPQQQQHETSRTSTLLDHPHPSSSSPVAVATEVTDADFAQATALWRIMARQDGAQARFVDNVSAHLGDVTQKWIRDGAYAMFEKVDGELGANVRRTTEAKIEGGHKKPHKTAWH